MYDTIIIGAGPAGISASLYAKRANKNVLVVYYGSSELEKAHKIENYYGFVDGIEGKNLYEYGIAQAKQLGVEVLEQEVTNITMNQDSSFTIHTTSNTFQAATVIMATGNKKVRPNIKGIKEFEGKGVSYCAICDGFFYRGKRVAVLGNGEYALSEANDLKHIVENIVILTDGLEAPTTTEYEVNTNVIAEVQGENKINSIVFKNGETLPIDGLFVAQGVAGGSNFAKKLGIRTKQDDTIIVDETMATNIPGLFVCGDLAGGLLQVSKAVYEGAKAGLAAVAYLNQK